MRIKKYIALLILACAFAGCRESINQPEQGAALVLNLCLPVQQPASHAPLRIMGDPGSYEAFALPKYAYIFITKKVGESWVLWRKDEIRLDSREWERTFYGGPSGDAKDDIYRYTGKILFLLGNDNPKGRVYVVCSSRRLTLTPSWASITTFDDVLNLKFNTAPDSIQESLQDIYSTPYNYFTDEDLFYCSYDCSAGNSYMVNTVLFHVASKVDVKWSVAAEQRINRVDPAESVRLTYMEARRLFNGNAYCFKPMRNELPAKLTSGYTIAEMVKPADEGLWWEGRTYFYTIPYTVTGAPDYFPLQMRLQTNESGDDYCPTLNLRIDTTAMFTPWLRTNFTITGPLSEEEPTRTVGG